ncbi:MAG TPA: pro-sigmaK processing inhibitor BofA family protein [Candidatus Saccharimonadales bacterium]|nr:pro-sigmaK processing inhibitor BofA family protein [Candidatus Saccharimonadales bacterium]
MLLALTVAAFFPEILIVLAILAVVFIIFFLGRFIIGMLVNSILGLLSIWILDSLFNLGIAISAPVIIVTALFGLPAVLVIVILRLFGVSI